MAEHHSRQNVSKNEHAPQDDVRPPGLLIIDDDASICTVIEKLAEKAGFTATRALSVEEATGLLRARRFDCITLDLSIGKNTGIELLGILSQMACVAPIIIISGSMRSMRDFAVSIGNNMNLVIAQSFSKPLDFAKLRETLIDLRKKIKVPQEIMPAA